MAETLLREVDNRLSSVKAPLLVDAYCGVGTFALSFASRFRKVIGIEESPWAVRDAQANCGDMDHVEFIAGTTEALLAAALTGDCVVILDPPRAGCSSAILDALIQSGVRDIIYVSCDPATLARDLGVLVKAGYRLGPLQPIDMFPQTGHIETIVALNKH
jgi:23S rRNA (uracil1939-C5)-methyltransferase